MDYEVDVTSLVKQPREENYLVASESKKQKLDTLGSSVEVSVEAVISTTENYELPMLEHQVWRTMRP